MVWNYLRRDQGWKKVKWRTNSCKIIDVSLLFIDASGTVPQDTIVYYSGYREENPSLSTDSNFKTMLVVPRGAVGMSFSMTDIAHEGGKSDCDRNSNVR